jgi:predicted RecA/RadA family phage recombinase
MANLSRYLQEAQALDHTPVGALTAGQIVQVNSLSALVNRSIAAGKLGSVRAGGVIRGPFVGGIGNVGDNVWWDANATPYGGVADGAFTLIAKDGDWWAGTLVAPTVAISSTCDIALNVVNPNIPAFIGKTHFATAVDLTLVAATHSGGVVHVTADAGTDTKITLPTGVAGMDFVIMNDAPDAGNLLQVDLDGNEIIAGANLTIAATKIACLTKATGLRGDFLHLVCNVAATSWRAVARRGIWVTDS